MKRALAVSGFSMLGTLLVFCNNHNDTTMSVAIIASLIVLLLSLLIKPVRQNRTLPTAFLSIMIALLILFADNSVYYKNAILYSEKEIAVTGSLTALPYKSDGRSYYIIETDTINGEVEKVGIRIASQEPIDLEPSDRINVVLKTFLLGGDDDGYLSYYKSKGVTLGAYIIGDSKIDKIMCMSVGDVMLRIRYNMVNKIMNVLPNDYGAVISGLVLGDKSNLSLRASNAFAACGVSHLFAVSGIHMSVWSLLFYKFAKHMRCSGKTASVISIFFCLFFMLLTGFNPPVVRAGFMMIIIYLSGLFSREAEAFNSIGLSLIVMLAINPYNAISLSLWLSLLATVGILILSPRIKHFLLKPEKRMKHQVSKKLYSYVVTVVAVSVAVSVFTMPVYVLKLKTISSLLLVSNLLMVSLGTLCMEISGVAALLLVLKAGFIGKPLMIVGGILSKLLLNTALLFSKFRYALLPVNSNYSKLMLALFALIIAGVLFFNLRNKKVIRALALSMASVFIFINAAVYFFNFNALRMTVADVGNGISVVMTYKGRNAVVGCGGEYFAESSICDIIKNNGITVIDYLIVPNNSSACSSAAYEIFGGYTIKNLYIYDEKEKIKFPSASKVNTVVIDKSVISLFDGEVTIAVDNKAAQIYYNGFHAVIAFYENCELNNAAGDVLVCRGQIPNGIYPGDFGCVVVSDTDTKNIWQTEFAGNICSTGYNGNISFLIKQNGEISMRRA